MHRTRNLIIFIVGCFTIVISCFLPWSHSPRYSLFTIADYAGNYGRYLSLARYASVAAFLIPLGISVALMSVAFERVCRVATIIFSTYSLVFAIGVILLVTKISDSFPSPTNTPGAYLCILASSFLLVAGISGKQRVHAA